MVIFKHIYIFTRTFHFVISVTASLLINSVILMWNLCERLNSWHIV